MYAISDTYNTDMALLLLLMHQIFWWWREAFVAVICIYISTILARTTTSSEGLAKRMHSGSATTCKWIWTEIFRRFWRRTHYFYKRNRVRPRHTWLCTRKFWSFGWNRALNLSYINKIVIFYLSKILSIIVLLGTVYLMAADPNNKIKMSKSK